MGTLRTRIGFFCCFLITCCIISTSSLWAVKKASIVICAETGKIYHAQDADAVTHPASLTKMMTLYLTFKALREGRLTLDKKLPVSKWATKASPSKLWLKAGSTLTVRQAILALVTKSANDAAVVLAEALGKGSETHFATLMTHQARQLGMSKTVFKNAHGLPNKQQITTARDMATLSRSLYKHFPEYFKFFKEPKFVYKGQVHANHNHLLGKIPGVDGIKTGFINASGFNLAASMVRDNRRIIAVVMGGESRHARDKKMVKLLEATHLYLARKGRPHNSIDDLLCTLAPSEANTPPPVKMKGKIHKAVDRPRSRSIKTLPTRYASVDEILDLDPFPEKKLTSKKKVQKATPKKRKKIAKKSPKKKPNNRVRKLKRKNK